MGFAGKKHSRKRKKEAVVEVTPVMPVPASPSAVTFDVLRPEIHAEVTSNAADMVRAMIQHAKDGQYQAMKYLFEMVGLYPAKSDEESPREDTLSGLLLSGLEIAEESGEQGHDRQGPVSAQANAVE